MSSMTISVLPIETGWLVQHEPGGEHLVFLSGGRAEAAARRMAEAASVAGTHSKVEIHTRGEDAIYEFYYEAA